jgi:hypothetical protein
MRYRARPPLNKQNYKNSCWAAAIDSFSRVNSHVPTLREKTLAHRWGDPADGYSVDGPQLGRMFESELRPHGCSLVVEASLVLPYTFEDKLENSHVVLVWQVPSSDWHAGLIYGIDNSTVSYMETRVGKNVTESWSHFFNPTGYVMIWRP